MPLSLPQLEQALRLVKWSPDELARQARVGVADLDQWRNGGAPPPERTVEAMRSALEAAGVSFTSSGAKLGGEFNDAQSISVDDLNTSNDK